MPVASLFSAPKENYLDHISRCKEKFDLLFPVYYSTIARTFDPTLDQGKLRDAFLKMILFHDLGKLTKRWQDNLGTNRKLPSHSTLGAAYLFNALPGGIKEPLSFAVAIHHTDKGLLGDNIERPDVQAILDEIVDNNGNIIWHNEIEKLTEDYFPNACDLKVSSLKEMARGFRIWAKGCGILEQHQRRIQASLAHHILKLCDICAATERKEYQKKDDQDYYGGWLMVENIRDYTENLLKNRRFVELQTELERWIEVLKREYNPEMMLLFGSFAQRKIKTWSDIDLLIVKSTDKPFLDRIKDVILILHPKVGLDVLVYTPEEFRKMCKERVFFEKEISKKGVKIYERGI
ncbi:MAG: CRISPR-associated endonuclease Cas3'' [bacterium]